MEYAEEGTPLVVLAGLRVRLGLLARLGGQGHQPARRPAVIAQSFERIHRSNLVGMGVLPLQFPEGESAASLGLTGEEEVSITGLDGGDADEVSVKAGDVEFTAKVRIDTPKERDYYKHGGILQFVLRQLMAGRLTRASLTSRAPMPVPETLQKLLAAAGPSGYEQAPAAVFREAAGAFADVTHDSVGSTIATVRGTARRPLRGHRRPHRRDRPDRPPHRRRRLPLVHRRRRLGPGDPRRPARRGLHARGRVLGVVGKKPIHLLKTEESRKKAPELKGLHIDIGAKDGDEARAKVRVGDVAVIAGEPVELPNGRLVSRSLDNRLGCFVALETARLVAEAGGAPGDVYADRRRAGGDHLRGRAHDRVLAAARRRDRRRRDLRHRRPRHRREGARPPPLRLRAR